MIMDRFWVLFLLLICACSSRQKISSAGNSALPQVGDSHPRLLINRLNLVGYRDKSTSTHQLLFQLVSEQAEAFSQRTIPAFQNAQNTYREIGDALPVLGLMYQVSGDQRYVNDAKQWVEALLATASWEGSQNLGRSSWVMGLAFTYDWLFDTLDEDLKVRLIDRLVKEVEIIISTASRTRALSNHLLIETSAVGIVGLILETEHEKKKDFIEQADRWARYIIDYAPLDGSWGEGVQYWQYGTGFFLRFLESALTAGYKNYYDGYHWLKDNGYFPIYFSLPDNLTKVINFSDCSTDRYLPAFLLYLPASKYGNAYFQDFGMKVQAKTHHKLSWLDFLFYDASVMAKDFTQLPRFRHFDDHGFVSMRSGWAEGSTVVGFRCGPAPGHRNQNHPDRVSFGGFGPGHQQPDINNFCIFSQNEWLVIDPGYTMPKETRNHNTFLVNGYGQAGAGNKFLDFMEFESREPAPNILHAENNEKYSYLIGDAGNIYIDDAGLAHFRRHLMFIKPDIVIILDDVLANASSTFEWLLQVNEIARIHLENDKVKITKNEAAFWLMPVLPYKREIQLQERIVKGSDAHGLPGHKEGVLKTINIRHKNESVRFLNVIAIQGTKTIQSPEVNYKNSRLSITVNGKKWLLDYMSDTSDATQPLLHLVL